MALQNVQIKEMSLVLSSDAKPRLKWTPELHQRFVDAVDQLGGAEKATPKSLMRVMGIQGLTLYHLKSHLQKYRLGRSQQSQTYHNNKQQDNGENQRSQLITNSCDGANEQINESVQVAHALQMQMEVQRKLHEQIEVQRHLQLRIEAQGKYLQSVLKKAQETLSGYSSCSVEVEHAKAQLSQLVSMVDSGCPSSPFSVLTESDGSMLKDARNKLLGHNGYSLESSLTSSESSDRKEETQTKHETEENYRHANDKANKGKRNSVVLSLMEMHPSENSESENQTSNRKKKKSPIDDEVMHREQSISDKSTVQNSDDEVQRFRSLANIDLNCKSPNDFDSGPKVIDLNFNGLELFNGTFSV
ncbi:Myb family transcription factor PHL8 [Sesamum alatum]|uniref:Myb family transcription factor PHL8 n=1 Tax=Sesamum alatum TaxID=300844 RepID=A0AAE1YGY2_9LAMI|nr:Myb family transcription factor PHL8 [Sesamum alatum]